MVQGDGVTAAPQTWGGPAWHKPSSPSTYSELIQDIITDNHGTYFHELTQVLLQEHQDLWKESGPGSEKVPLHFAPPPILRLGLEKHRSKLTSGFRRTRTSRTTGSVWLHLTYLFGYNPDGSSWFRFGSVWSGVRFLKPTHGTNETVNATALASGSWRGPILTFRFHKRGLQLSLGSLSCEC